MIKEVTATGNDITEAKENARLALGADELADVKYEILHAGSKGLLGFFVKPARVKATIELPDSAPRRTPRPEKAERSEKPERSEKSGERHERKPQPQRESNAQKNGDGANRRKHNNESSNPIYK